MKRSIPWIALLCAVVWLVANSWIPTNKTGTFDVAAFVKIPVMSEGRLKPIDTIARNTLFIIHGKQALVLEDGRKIDADKWLLDLFFNAPLADSYPSFVINNPDVLGLFGWRQNERKYFSFSMLSPYLNQINEQGQKGEDVPSAKRTPYQIAIQNLRNSLLLYQRLKNSLYPDETTDFSEEIKSFERVVPSGLDATVKRSKNESFDEHAFDLFAQYFNQYETMAEMAYILPVPKDSGTTNDHEKWIPIGASLLQSVSTGKIDIVSSYYARIGDAFHSGDVGGFNRSIDDLRKWMLRYESRPSGRASYEFVFNQLEPFYQAMGLYVLAFLLICISWLCCTKEFNKAAFWVILLALAVHSFGLFSRMYLQGRPPVTNLYSSAIFIGWGTVIIGLILERIFKDGIGSICAAIIGFTTLIIAHHLAGSGDTLEMLQAVLDTNIWLATHVVAITTGYSAMFLAGTLATIYVVRGVFTSSLTKQMADSLTRMTYGVMCFATLFSFVGTVLGGIWADQSWGRFWGWDPKENGALLIVLWCAISLHARWGGYIKGRGLMIMALFGNVITSFSWFGVNMLGVGLHSYGFMNKALPWLGGFIVSQLILMAIASLPLSYWRSFRNKNVISVLPVTA